MGSLCSGRSPGHHKSAPARAPVAPGSQEALLPSSDEGLAPQTAHRTRLSAPMRCSERSFPPCLKVGSHKSNSQNLQVRGSNPVIAYLDPSTSFNGNSHGLGPCTASGALNLDCAVCEARPVAQGPGRGPVGPRAQAQVGASRRPLRPERGSNPRINGLS